MMSKSWFLLCLMVVALAACSPTVNVTYSPSVYTDYLKAKQLLPKYWGRSKGNSKNFAITKLTDIHIDTLNKLDTITPRFTLIPNPEDNPGERDPKDVQQFDADWADSKFKGDTLVIKIWSLDHEFTIYKIISDHVITNHYQSFNIDTVINNRNTTFTDSLAIPIKILQFTLSSHNLKQKFLYGFAEIEMGPYFKSNYNYRGNHVKLLMRRKYYFRTSRPKDSVAE